MRGIRQAFLVAAALALGVTAAAAQTLVVGGKNFTEQQLMAEMTTQLLTAKGFKVDKRAGLGTAPLRQALETGQIDLYWEYTGTSLITFNKVTDKLDPAATYAKVKELDGAKGLGSLLMSMTSLRCCSAPKATRATPPSSAAAARPAARRSCAISSIGTPIRA